MPKTAPGPARQKQIVIVQNTTLAENYGLSSYLRNIIQALAQHDDLHITLICCQGQLNKSTCPDNVTLYEIAGSTYSLGANARFFVKVFKILRQLSRERGVDIVHCLYPNSSLAAAVLYKLTVGHRQKPTLVYDLRSPWIHVAVERGSIPRRAAPVFRAAAYLTESFLGLFVDRFIFITEGLRQHYRRYLRLRGKPVAVIPSGIDTSYFQRHPTADIRAQYHLQESDIVVGYVGVLSKFRNLGFVMKAFAKTTDPRLKLMFVGDGDAQAELKHLASALTLEDRVIFTGRVPHDEVGNYVAAFDAGICHLPDTFVFRQSYPMKVLEYLASGIPVLASDIRAHQDISQHFPEVELYDDTADLTSKLSALPARGRHRHVPDMINHYDWKAIARDISQAY